MLSNLGRTKQQIINDIDLRNMGSGKKSSPLEVSHDNIEKKQAFGNHVTWLQNEQEEHGI